MSDTPSSRPPLPAAGGAPAAAAERRSLALLVAAAALVVVVVVLVLIFGVARPPALAPIDAAPALTPPGQVAWVAWEQDGQCLWVARTDGRVDDLRCDREGGEVTAWTDEGIVLRSWREAGEQLLVVDPDDGTVVDRRSVEPEYEGPVGVAVFAERRDGILVVLHERDERVVWGVEAPPTYDLRSSAVSPDGDWVAMVDSAERLLLVPIDGSVEPRVWAENVSSWSHLVWEGFGPER